jgi:hypothetical protein
MSELNNLIQPIMGAVIVALAAAVLLLLGLIWWQSNRLKSLGSQLSTLIDGADGENVEQMLIAHADVMKGIQDSADSREARLTAAESKLVTAKRFIGLVRYDAFDDIGGDQSFSLAVYDDDGNGAVLTSQVGRADSRIFGKELRNGQSKLGLSDEEAEAIARAVGQRNAK